MHNITKIKFFCPGKRRWHTSFGQRDVLVFFAIEALSRGNLTRKSGYIFPIKMQPQYVSTITTTTVSGPPSYDKLEQPPTYDETDLRVNLPDVHSTVVKTRADEEEQAGPLPEKKRPSDDESSA